MAVWSSHWQNDARVFHLFAGGVQNRQREGSILGMWAPWAAPGLDTDFGDHSIDQQQCHWNPGRYAGGSTVSVQRALTHPYRVLAGEGGLCWMKDGIVCSLGFLQHFPLNGTFTWRSWSSLFFHASFSVLLTFQGLCWHLSLEGWSKSNRLQLLGSQIEKQERSPHKAVVFARDTWETQKGSCLPCSL